MVNRRVTQAAKREKKVFVRKWAENKHTKKGQN